MFDWSPLTKADETKPLDGIYRRLGAKMFVHLKRALEQALGKPARLPDVTPLPKGATLADAWKRRAAYFRMYSDDKPDTFVLEIGAANLPMQEDLVSADECLAEALRPAPQLTGKILAALKKHIPGEWKRIRTTRTLGGDLIFTYRPPAEVLAKAEKARGGVPKFQEIFGLTLGILSRNLVRRILSGVEKALLGAR